MAYIRENPAASLFSDWWGSKGDEDLMALTLAPVSRRLHGLEIDVTILNRSSNNKPLHVHARYASELCVRKSASDWVPSTSLLQLQLHF